MRIVIAVDLATRFSAGLVRTAGGEVVRQWDSVGRSHSVLARYVYSEYLTALTTFGALTRPIVVVEDLPPHVPSSLVRTQVAQLQGRIIQEFSRNDGIQLPNVKALEDLFFVPPAIWQHEMGVWRATPEQTAAVAAGLGYEPPDLTARWFETHDVLKPLSSTQRAALAKQTTDYVDAFLISEWTRRCMAEGRVWDSKTIKQYKD